MKRLLSSLMILSIGITFLHAQEQETPTRSNDIMISPIELIATPLLNVSYERLLNENSGIGVNGMFFLGDKDKYDDSNTFFQISPYYRLYFGKKYASGLFVEGFLPITSTSENHDIYNNDGNFVRTLDETVTSFGVGIGFGGKWVAKKNIIFEASVGVGRRFGDTDKISALTGKGMLGIGYRF